jgi:hypothetical protein
MPSNCMIMGADEKLGDLSLYKPSTGCFQKFLEANLGAALNIWRRSAGGVTLAVVSNGHIVGVIKYENARHLSWQLPGYASLLIDCACPSVRYKHLAKLIVRCAISKEARLLLESSHKTRVVSVATTAYSNHPESMKYRGLFKLQYRERLKDGRYRLRYQGAFTDKTLAQHLAEWLATEPGHSATDISRAGSVDGDTAFPTVEDGSSPYPALYREHVR